MSPVDRVPVTVSSCMGDFKAARRRYPNSIIDISDERLISFDVVFKALLYHEEQRWHRVQHPIVSDKVCSRFW